MDIPNTTIAPLVPVYRDRKRENRRDTIMVRLRPVNEEEHKRWHGAPPTVVPEKDKTWRPSEVLF
jgi:hypothetical protein